MSVEIAMKVGQAAGHIFAQKTKHARPTVVIGKDTRVSGYMVESALQAGFTSVGFFTLLVGPMPTPAVSFLTRSLRADLGVMISASHNEFMDNGIKLFGPDGFKLPDSVEHEIEALMDGSSDQKIELADAAKIGILHEQIVKLLRKFLKNQQQMTTTKALTVNLYLYVVHNAI